METEVVENAQYKLPILQFTKESQLQNGLRHGDYLRYRQYCTRRLHRIRRALHFTNGKGKFNGKKLHVGVVSNERFLHIPLVQAERAWAYAMQLKHDNKANEARPRFHAQRRLRKAAQWARVLQEFCEAKCDKSSQLEAKAYAHWLHGSLHMELGYGYNKSAPAPEGSSNARHLAALRKAIEHFAAARTMYTQLGAVGGLLQQSQCEGRVEEEIAPAMRYCEYQMGESVSADELAKLVGGGDEALLEEVMAEQASSMQALRWLGHVVDIPSETVRVCILKANEMVRDVATTEALEKKMALYDRAIFALNDASEAVKDEFRTASGQGSSDKVLDNLNRLHRYISHEVLQRTIARDEMMATRDANRLRESMRAAAAGEKASEKGKQVTATGVVGWFDRLIASADEVGELLDVADDAEETPEARRMRTAAAAAAAAYKAHRAYWLAESYVAVAKYAEASLLFERAAERAEDAERQCGAAMATGAAVRDGLAAGVEALYKVAKGRMYLALAQNHQTTSGVESGVGALAVKSGGSGAPRTLRERLGEFDAGPRKGAHKLTSFPPAFCTMACKPVSFDLAGSLMDFPDVSHKCGEKKAAPQQAQKGGGFFSGWW